MNGQQEFIYIAAQVSFLTNLENGVQREFAYMDITDGGQTERYILYVTPSAMAAGLFTIVNTVTLAEESCQYQYNDVNDWFEIKIEGNDIDNPTELNFAFLNDELGNDVTMDIINPNSWILMLRMAFTEWSYLVETKTY